MAVKVLICDDREDRREHWKEDLDGLIPDGWEIELLTEEDEGQRDLDHELGVLRARQLLPRPKEDQPPSSEERYDPDSTCRFDETSVLIVDYDLIRFGQPGLTGETVTYLARCFSKCKVIVGVNVTGQANSFDLTLVDHLDSFADLNIGSDQLKTPILWDRDREALSPWAWPSLVILLKQHEECVATVEANPKAKVRETLGLAGLTLPRKITQPIEAAEEEDPDFECFARESSLGLHGDDLPWEGTVARVGASRARKWLQHLLLPAQDILVDAPHLAQRNPLLLREADPASLSREDFEATADRSEGASALAAELERHRLPSSPWLDRPVWHWAAVNSDDDLPGVASPWDRPEVEFFFCEDVARFLPANLTRPFVVDDVPTSYSVRYVAKPNEPAVTGIVGEGLAGVKYLPKVRLTY
jgi:hypothetical protein